jgi:acyl carrier protein
MTTDALRTRIADILHTQFQVPLAALGPDASFDGLGFDSLVIVELGLVLENEFGAPVEDGELTSVMTLTEAAELVAGKVAVQG